MDHREFSHKNKCVIAMIVITNHTNQPLGILAVCEHTRLTKANSIA